jgi:uncharacterized protein YhaN
MKILSLDLMAWGPFTGKSIDLSSGQEGMHIIFGANEAGKSSTLRGLRALFFGIPERPQDNFLHENTQLRIGASLRRSDGSELAVIRRKGRSKTLLAPDQSALGDDVLRGFLGGVDAGLFSRLFGISHIDLVEGGRDILTGKGGVGESLFSAAMGGGRLRELLASLKEEAEGLYVPRRNAGKWINTRLERFAQARKTILELSLPGQDWEEHNRLLKEAEQEKEKTLSSLTGLRSETHRIERLQKALPLIAERQEILRQQADLGPVLVLPVDFAEIRRKTNDGLQQCHEMRVEAERRIEQIRLQLGKLCIPEVLLAKEERVSELHKALGTHQKAMKDLPKREAELEQLEQDACAILAELRPGLSLGEAESLRLQVATRERVRNLAAAHAALLERQRATDRSLRSIEARLSKGQAQLDALGDPKESQELRAVLKRWQKQGDMEAALSEAKSRLRSETKQAEVELQRLPLWTADLNALEALPLPPEETVRRFENEFAALEATREAVRQRLRELEQRRGELSRNIESLKAAASVPSEEDLAQSRNRREAGWELVRNAWLGGGGDETAIGAFSGEMTLDRAYERSVRNADDVADRLRHEADRVAQNATWLAELDRLTSDLREASGEEKKAEVALTSTHDCWNAIWQPLGIGALTPREMRGWMQCQKDLVERAGKVRACAHEVERIEAAMSACRSELDHVMTALGAPAPGDTEMHTRLLERCQRLLEEIGQVEQQRRQLRNTLEGLHADKEEAGIEHQGAALEMTKWAADWAGAVREFGLGEELTPGAANAVLDRFDALFAKVGEASKTRQRIAGMERDSSDFAREIGNLVADAAPDLIGAPAERAAVELNARVARAREDRATRTNLLAQLHEQEVRLEQTQGKQRQLELRLTDLCREAQCEKADELENAERVSDRARELREKNEKLTGQLALLVGSGTIEDLILESQETDADSLSAHREEIAARILALESRLSRAEQAIGEERARLAQMDGTSRAAEVAEEAQSTLAEIRDGVEKYVRLRAASALLSAAMEEYRARNQAPVVTRASDIFSVLTAGSFSGLGTQYDEEDRPVLVGVRPGGLEEVRVEGMSEGTRDQLYLALRLASIEKHLESNEPLPFIVDDVLINFDNRRSEATLKELGKLCEKTQVIFFTHHEHLVDLARASLPQNRLFVHSL